MYVSSARSTRVFRVVNPEDKRFHDDYGGSAKDIIYYTPYIATTSTVIMNR
jgi:hypothetical protein